MRLSRREPLHSTRRLTRRAALPRTIHPGLMRHLGIGLHHCVFRNGPAKWSRRDRKLQATSPRSCHNVCDRPSASLGCNSRPCVWRGIEAACIWGGTKAASRLCLTRQRSSLRLTREKSSLRLIRHRSSLRAALCACQAGSLERSRFSQLLLLSHLSQHFLHRFFSVSPLFRRILFTFPTFDAALLLKRKK